MAETIHIHGQFSLKKKKWEFKFGPPATDLTHQEFKNLVRAFSQSRFPRGTYSDVEIKVAGTDPMTVTLKTVSWECFEQIVGYLEKLEYSHQDWVSTKPQDGQNWMWQ